MAARATTVGLTALGLLSGAVGTAGAAGDDNGLIDESTYQSPAHGYVVQWDEPWTPSLTDTTHEPGYDSLSLISPAGDVSIKGVALDWSPEELNESSLEGLSDEDLFEDFEVLDEGERDGVAYLLFSGEGDDGTWIIYFEARQIEPEDGGAKVLVQSNLIAEADSAAEALADAEEIEVDGEPVFSVLEADDLQSDDDEEADDDEAEDRDDREDADADEEDDRGGREDEDDRSDRADENGLIDEFTYESPSHGYVVEWDLSWVVSPDETDTEGKLDRLTLYTVEGDAMLQIMGTAASWTPEQVVDAYVEDFQSADDALEVSDLGVEDGVAFALLEDEAGDVAIYVEAQEHDGIVLVAALLSTGEGLEDNLSAAYDEIAVDGDPIFVTSGAAKEAEADEEDASADDEEADADEDSVDRDEDDRQDDEQSDQEESDEENRDRA
jgi:hypothetical protein